MSQVKARKKTTTIGSYLLDTLYSHGVDQIFGLPGDYVLGLDKLIEKHEIQFINTTRENTAGFMADAYARLRGFGVACITYGVGINITNAISQAYVESSPLVVISGAASTEEVTKNQLLHHLINTDLSDHRDVTQFDIFKKITAAQAVLDDPHTAASDINRILEVCFQQKKPVYLEIPRDKVNQEIPSPHPYTFSLPKSDSQALKEALLEIEEILLHSKQSVIWAGHDIQRYRLAKELLEFAEKLNIPIATSLLGKACISEYHPLSLGIYQGKMSLHPVLEYVESSDCAFVLGVILSDVDTGLFTSKIQPKNQILASPDSVTINHHQYHNVYLSDFIQGLASLDLNMRYHAPYPAAIDRPLSSFIPKKGKKMTYARLFECLQKYLKPGHLVVSDIGECLFGSSELILDQNCYLSNAYFANLGFGVPGALGAQIAMPEKRVVAIVGDGAFQMTCMELSTAVRYQLDPIIILLNNHGFATERSLVEGQFNDIVNWRYTEIPHVLGGGKGLHATTEELFDKALSKAFSSRGEFYLIEVEMSKTDFSPALKRFTHLLTGKRHNS